MIRTYSQMHRTDKYSQHSSIICPVWLNGWVFVYELSGCGFESSCSHLNFRLRACFAQGVPWHSGNYRVWIHSETRTWHDKNIQPKWILSILSTNQSHMFAKSSFNCFSIPLRFLLWKTRHVSSPYKNWLHLTAIVISVT